MKRPTLESSRERRARVTRINRKRPPYGVEIEREPDPQAQDDLVEVLYDVLDPLVRSKPE